MPVVATPHPSAPVQMAPATAGVAAAPVTETPSSPVVLAPKAASQTAATPVPTATPDPLLPYTITGMRARSFPGGQIRKGPLLEQQDGFSRYAIAYPSDGLLITGVMNIPPGAGPFPVIVLLHGYYDRDRYSSGAGTWQAAAFLARHGYLTIAPDFRSWGGSGSGASLFHMGLVADVLNLIGSLPSLPEADIQRVGLWGHSMGGGIAMKVLAIDERPRAAVLYAPNSADDADLIARWGPGCRPGESEAAGDKCNPAEVIGDSLPPELLEAYLRAAADPAALRRVSPLFHLQNVKAPIQIHVGTEDGARLAETPPVWSEELALALQAAGKEAVLFTYPGEGHFFQPSAWTQFMERALALFDAQVRAAAS